MSYRLYRLKRTVDKRSSTETTERRIYIKNLNITLKNHTFTGNNPIRILEFLTRFVN